MSLYTITSQGRVSLQWEKNIYIDIAHKAEDHNHGNLSFSSQYVYFNIAGDKRTQRNH